MEAAGYIEEVSGALQLHSQTLNSTLLGITQNYRKILGQTVSSLLNEPVV